MFAVIKTGGKQYSVESGRTLKIEKVLGKKGDSFTFNNVLIIGDGQKQILGTPEIKGASVQATILSQIRDKKVTVFKKKRRKNYRRTKGHRQYLTIVKINKILNSTIEKNIKTPKEKIVEKKVVKKKVAKKKSTSTSIKKNKTVSNKNKKIAKK